MPISRREFIELGAAGTLALSGRAAIPIASGMVRESFPLAGKPLRILILGGTGFIGPNQVRYALSRGHHVTLFNRGKTNPGVFKGMANLEERIGDRAPTPGNYDALRDGEWDVVIDNPTTRPRWVREAAAALKGRVKHYVFISTLSVYASNDKPGMDESAPVATTTTPDVEDGATYAALYGPLKALAEAEAERAFPGRTTVIRPGLIVGVGDATDRFTYWPARLARGGEVLAPPANDPVQLIDARDLGEWTIRCCEEGHFGVFNATGPGKRFTVREMLEGSRAVVGGGATITYASTAFLRDQRINGWSDLPVWLPTEGRTAGFTQRSNAKAIAHGLTFRPFPETVRETLAFYQSQPAERQAALKAGLKADREREVLAAWHAAGGSGGEGSQPLD